MNVRLSSHELSASYVFSYDLNILNLALLKLLTSRLMDANTSGRTFRGRNYLWTKMSLAEISVDEINSGRQCLWTNFPWTKLHLDELSVDEITSGRTFRGRNYIWTKLTPNELTVDEVSVDEVSVDEVSVDEVSVDYFPAPQLATLAIMRTELATLREGDSGNTVNNQGGAMEALKPMVTYGPPMAYLWPTYGPPMAYLVPMASLWPIYGPPMARLWPARCPHHMPRRRHVFDATERPWIAYAINIHGI